jgi:uncharacterized hydrophobic protein (TIGR00271 family)
MPLGLSARVLPDSQRRTIPDLVDDLDLTSGDDRSKRSAFWTMLTLSALIATAGVITDSTATVIGAMIIAPLSTPIMGIALGLATREPGAAARSSRYVVVGGLLVVAIGTVFGWALPGSFELLSNGQITGRTSPGLLDLVAAVATGFAGAIALARRDVSAVLPGVAIAISLVPPLAVVGVCLGDRAPALAFGALMLFLSNLVALVLAGTLVFTVLAYTAAKGTDAPAGASHRRTYLTLVLATVVVAVPLLANTVATLYLSLLTGRVEEVASTWVEQQPGASVSTVNISGTDLVIEVQTPSGLPPVDELLDALREEVPQGVRVVVTSTVGERIDAGTVEGT